MTTSELTAIMAAIMYPFCNQDGEEAVEAADYILAEVARTKEKRESWAEEN